MRGMTGGEWSLLRLVGPSNPETLLPSCGFVVGELVPEDARDEMVGRTGGSRGSSSAIRLMELVLEFVLFRASPFTGLDVLDLFVAAAVLMLLLVHHCCRDLA